MDDIGTYVIRISGPVDVNEINALSPVLMTLVSSDPGAVCFSARTDQSGMVGLLRHLHALGLVLLSVSRVEIQTGAENAPDRTHSQWR